MKNKVYLDGAANAPIDDKVIKAMKPYLTRGFCGNPNSAHQYGAESDQAVHSARMTIARCLGVWEEEVLFTSGATESNNWVIKALAMRELAKPPRERRTRIVCSATEHSSVLAACDSLKPLGFEVVRVDPRPDGSASFIDMCQAIRSGRTFLVCCMAVNNETGVYNAVGAVSMTAHDVKAVCLCDVTQALLLGGATVNLGKVYPEVDMFSFSAHKIYGPMGVGCLVKRNWVDLPPLISGGTQEFGLRGGTNNVAGIVGMAKAVQMLADGPCLHDFYRGLMDFLRKSCSKVLGRDLKLTAQPSHPNIVSASFGEFLDYPGVLADAFAAKGIAVSAGAACSNGTEGQQPSHVLASMGLDERTIRHVVRVSFTKFTTKKDIKAFVKALAEIQTQYPLREKGE